MKTRFGKRFATILVATNLTLASTCGWAQAVNGSASSSNSAPGPTVPPPLPAPKSPVYFFRELLAMKGPERQQALTNRPPEVQKRIIAKIREYEAMDANSKELRLQRTELEFYLVPLMRVPPAERTAQLANIPEDSRVLVEARLQKWDTLSADTQKELLENYATVLWLIVGAEPPKPEDLAHLASTLQPGLRRWQELAEDQREKIIQRVKQFFDLTPEEKQRVFGTLSEPERKQIEKTLNEYAKLTPAQRAQCLASFHKFANLSAEERRQFLKTAERWKLMTPVQRQAWKDLVNKLPPPLPGADQPPPIPRPAMQPRPVPSVATNR